MTPAQNRNLFRWLHIIAAGVIGTYIYSPWTAVEWFRLLVQLVVIPAIAFTGLWMWKGQQWKKLFRKDKKLLKTAH